MWDRGIVSSVGTNYTPNKKKKMVELRESSPERIKFKKRWKKWESRERLKKLARSNEWMECRLGY